MHSTEASSFSTKKGFSPPPILSFTVFFSKMYEVLLETFIAKTSELNVKSKPQYSVPTTQVRAARFLAKVDNVLPSTW